MLNFGLKSVAAVALIVNKVAALELELGLNAEIETLL